ncbi:hypothetical protein ASPZODRAFT_149708 [Penicilliopsis zonata CBS 506.65]|uniref:CFEM domain-containing protein n=1 Tax=Penicilliopsis zonata CBS 506.65 TaxID=1073090 RepID=A0A1L9ST32_9EURO|nr:hypothetical protein ASPZODRAFT_149708 [Penicilliopsis zonata CBS 506.65]OJJ50368.1 hypothetical protein ASPZODRAFT_149708 [Penicilliopsis zonata CBS 506.65]
MRFSWLALVLFSLSSLGRAELSLSSALTELPACALACLVDGLEGSSCGTTNVTCQCNSASLQSNVTSCIEESCTIIKALEAKNITQTLCDAPVRDRSVEYKVLSIALGGFSIFFVLTRVLYKLFWGPADLGVDDYVVLSMVILAVPNILLNVRYAATNGLGRDIWTLKPDQITRFLLFFYHISWFYLALVALLKLALLFFYRRIFPGKGVQLILWVTIFVDIVFGLVFVCVSVFQCQPIDYYWNRWDGEHQGTCLNINAITWSNAIISIALDLWMLAIPLWQLTKLQMHWKKKAGVALMFCVGAFVTIVSAIRLSSLVNFANSTNPTWDEWDAAVWSTIEINVGIICACMPTMRVILVRLFPRLMGSTRSDPRHYYESGSRSRGRNRSTTRRSGFPSIPQGKDGIVRSMTYTVDYGDDEEVINVRHSTLNDSKNVPRIIVYDVFIRETC